MLNEPFANTLNLFRRFSIEDDAAWSDTVPNIFQKVPDEIVENLEKSSGSKLPEEFRKFLLEVGWGRYTQDSSHRTTWFHLNVFMHPDRILNILNMESLEWSVGEEFCGADEVPFFDIGDSSVLVFRGKDGSDSSVYRPFARDYIASSFEDFLRRLYDDVEFYNRV